MKNILKESYYKTEKLTASSADAASLNDKSMPKKSRIH